MNVYEMGRGLGMWVGFIGGSCLYIAYGEHSLIANGVIGAIAGMIIGHLLAVLSMRKTPTQSRATRRRNRKERRAARTNSAK